METQSLFYTNLPNDIIHEIYWKLCKLKTICTDLKNEIVAFHMLDDIYMKYKKAFPGYDESHNNYYYIDWLENDLTLKLNNHRNIMEGVCPELQREHPFITLEFLHRKDINLKSRIFKLWSLMNVEKKYNFIQQLS